MAKKNKQNQSENQLNDYEKTRELRVEENNKRLRDMGVKTLANSFTRHVDSQKVKKKIVKPHNTNAKDVNYIPDMADDSEGDHQQVATRFKKHHRVLAPNVSQNFPLESNATKENQFRSTSSMAAFVSSNKESHMRNHNRVNGLAKRRPALVDEDDQEYDDILQDVNGEDMGPDGLKDDANERDFIKLQDTVCQTEQENGDVVTRKKRGITCGKGARKVMKASNMKLPLEFDFDTRQVISENESAFMHECGYILRNNCSLQFKEWRHVPNAIRLPLRHKLTTLFDIDVEDSNICKVIDSYMARAWRYYRATLYNHFKKVGGSEDPTKGKTMRPSNVSEEDWIYLCDMWCNTEFQEIAKKRVMARGKRKINSRHGSKSTIRYHLEHRGDLDCSWGQIETWRLTHWNEEKGWISEDAAVAYEDMMKLRKLHSVEVMNDKSILEKVLGRSSVRLRGWGRDPANSKNTMGTTRKSKRPSYDELVDSFVTLKESNDELVDAFVTLKGTCAIMQQTLIENNMMSMPPSNSGPNQGDTSESDESVSE